MAERQYFAEGVLIQETGERQYFAEGVLIQETVTADAAGNPYYYYMQAVNQATR